MAKSPNQKTKLLHLARMLLRQTDEDHPLTVAQIIGGLARADIKAERKSIYDDLEALRLFGLDVQCRKGKAPGWFIGSREFELPEVKLLMDAVQSTRFITQKKSDALIRKLESLASVHQAGQLVTADRLRFDFSHFAAMTQEELSAVEELVNSFILSAIPITTSEMPIDEAKRVGAMALFGEKYGDTVRVVSMEDASIELCGGTHLDSTSKIGLFKITSESGVAAGVRRIEAVTGKGVLDFINRSLGLINESAAALKLANPNDLARRCHAVQEELRELERKNSAMSDAIAELRSSALLANVVIIDGIKLVVSNVNGAKPDDIRRMAESIRSKGDDIVVVMACVNEGRVNLCAACGKEAVSRGVPAGKLVSRVASLIGGKGGGRPETAMAGGGDEEKLGAAMMQVDDILREFLAAGK